MELIKKIKVLQGSSSLKWAILSLFPSNNECGGLFFSPVQSNFGLLFGKASSDAGGRAIFFAACLHQVSSVADVWCADNRHTRFLCILHDRYFVAIALYSLEKKRINTVECRPLPHPLHPLLCRPPGLLWLHPVSPNYSTFISYNFFIFCLICLKFLHKFLHTNCFILSIIKNNWKFDDFA